MANKKGIGLGVAAVAAYAAKNHKKDATGGHATQKKEASDFQYRNTELGRYDKNSKGIYYTNGNYEAFARPRKPEGVDDKNAYIVGSGLASLAAACFLVRDGQMPGNHIGSNGYCRRGLRRYQRSDKRICYEGRTRDGEPL